MIGQFGRLETSGVHAMREVLTKQVAAVDRLKALNAQIAAVRGDPLVKLLRRTSGPPDTVGRVGFNAVPT
jgi:hypothetical protein